MQPFSAQYLGVVSHYPGLDIKIGSVSYLCVFLFLIYQSKKLVSGVSLIVFRYYQVASEKEILWQVVVDIFLIVCTLCLVLPQSALHAAMILFCRQAEYLHGHSPKAYISCINRFRKHFRELQTIDTFICLSDEKHPLSNLFL